MFIDSPEGLGMWLSFELSNRSLGSWVATASKISRLVNIDDTTRKTFVTQKNLEVQTS